MKLVQSPAELPVRGVPPQEGKVMLVSRVSLDSPSVPARFCLCLVFAASLLLAQQDSGSIVGTITDPAGAVIPSVAVRVINTGTNITTNLVTDQNGDFTATALRIGTYRLEAEAPGFKKTVQENIELRVQDRLRIDLRLQVGEVTETVEVAAAQPLLQTQTSSVGQVMETKSIADLPLNGRSYLQLIVLAPGAFVPQRMNTIWNDQFVAINGNRAMQNTFLLDGVNNNTTDNSNPAILPPPDAIAEFKVQTNAMSAEFGRSAGGAINVSIKSGSNGFHGNAFEFMRNQAVDANAFFNSGRTKPKFLQNQFGGTLGGPIQKDKAFFFVDYQGTRLRNGHTDVVTVPTPDQRTGDFSNDANRIFDPMTSRPNPAGAGFIRDPFPGNIIPDARISPVAKKVIALYPLPQIAGARVNNFIGNGVQQSDTNQFDVRVDQRISQHDSMFARASVTLADHINPGSLVSVASGSFRFPSNGGTPGRGAAYGYTHVFTPRLLNEFRAGFARLAWFGQVWNPSQRGADLLGIPGVPQTSQTFGLPNFTIAGDEFLGDQGLLPVKRGKNVFNFLDNLSYTLGRHALKMGVDLRRTQFNINQPGGPRGQFTFDGVFTRQPATPAGTGIGAADLLLGYADTANISNSVTIGVRIHSYSGFFMDDWKVTNKLTLNVGVRYDVVTPPVEVKDRQLTFDFSKNQVVFAKPGSYRDRAFTDVKLDSFAPRIGLAYSLTPTTVLRGGYGIFWAFEDNGTFNPAFNFPFRFNAAFPSDQINPSTAIRLDTGFPASALTVFVPANQTLGVRDGNLRPAYVQQWNYTLERQFKSYLLSASYVGNKGTHLARQVQRNQPVPGPGAVNDRRPVAGYGNINTVESSGNSIYHGLLTKVEKRFASGVSFLMSYTFSKAIEDSGSPALDSTSAGSDQPMDPRNLRLDRGLSPNDVRHRFVYSYIYELPFGKGKRFLNAAPKGLDLILGGWQVNGVTSLQSGRHITVVNSVDASNTGTSNPRANQLRDYHLPKSQRTLQQFIDTSAFAVQPIYTYGNAGRNSVEGPGQVNFDFSAFKNFRLNPDAKGHFRPDEIQFRSEFFNILNTPQFFIPNRTLGVPQFGSITDVVNNARQIQFALKFIF
jgi:hypothetical protein